MLVNIVGYLIKLHKIKLYATQSFFFVFLSSVLVKGDKE